MATAETKNAMEMVNRTDRSKYSRVLQSSLRPFKPHLVTPKKSFPAGSPKLHPSSTAEKMCDVKERKVEDIWLYDMTPKASSTQKTNGAAANGTAPRIHRIYYFAGGSYQQPPSSQHWKFCAALVKRLPNTVITVVSHPLAPESPAPVTLPQLQRLYRTLMAQSKEAGELVTVAGDSSGGNLALVLVLDALKERQEGDGQEETPPPPAAVLAVSPTVDSSKSNDAIDELDKVDAILTAAFTKSVAETWRRDWDPYDPRLSPVKADVASLARNGVLVLGVTGGYDILSADALAFRDMCAQNGVRGRWLHWEGQMHCFPLAFGYKVPEAIGGFDWIADALSRVAKAKS